MLGDEFDQQEGDWFSEKAVWIDLGYLGFTNDYETMRTHVPIKRKRRRKKTDAKIEFTEEEKSHNHQVSSKRIYVEHAIGGIKRYRFLSDRLRCRNARFYTKVMRVCAGIWNFQLAK